MTKTVRDHVQLFVDGEWSTFNLGDEMPLADGVFLGRAGSVVVYGGFLVAAWEERHHSHFGWIFCEISQGLEEASITIIRKIKCVVI